MADDEAGGEAVGGDAVGGDGPAPPARRLGRTARTVLIVLGVLLGVSGLLVLAAVILFFVGMSQWANNK